MKSTIVFVAIAFSQLISALPLGDILGGGLLGEEGFGDFLGGAVDTSTDLEGLVDGNLVGNLFDGSVIEDKGDILSSVGNLFDVGDLGLVKRASTGLLHFTGDDLTEDAIAELLLKAGAVGTIGYPTLGRGFSTHWKKLLADALIQQGISILSTLSKRYVLENGIGGETGAGTITLAGALNELGAGVVSVGGLGASGHVGRELANGSGGQAGAGVIGIAGVLDHIGEGGVIVGGLGSSGHVGR